MVTDGCTTITWNYQSSPAKNKHPLYQRNRQNDTHCVDKRSWHCSLLSKVSTVSLSVLLHVCQTLRTEQRIKQIVVQSITSLPTNYKRLFSRTKMWHRWRLVISIVSTSPWLWIITLSLGWLSGEQYSSKGQKNSHRFNSHVFDPRENEGWASWLPIWASYI